jgi:hypothetical protein
MIKRFSFLTFMVVCGLATAYSQPVPKLNPPFPEWVQRGTTTEIIFSGENLAHASQLLFSNDSEAEASGITVSNLKVEGGKTLKAKIKVASDSLPGEREVRLVTPTGVSEPVVLNLSDLPEVQETGTNNSPEKAQSIVFPAVINGHVMAASEIDFYRFHGRKGEQLIFDVYASRMGSPLDSSLAVLGIDGRELARNEDANGFDSLIEFTVPETADYLLQLRDFRFKGGGDFKYRLYAGTIPYLEAIFPLGGRRGDSVEIALSGRNLARPTLTNNITSTAPLGLTEIRGETGGHVSNPKSFEVGDLPEFIEVEPNDTAEQANNITIPVTINGRIARVKDVDLFKFKSDKDQRLLCEVKAQRLGSRLDTLLTLSDSHGKVLAQNDDATGMDARIDYDKFVKGEEYVFSIRDLNERGGENFGYRFSIHPPEPDFVVKFFPDIPRVSRGSHTTTRCEVTRTGGFPGAVRVSFEGLPAGVYCEPLVLTTEKPSTGLMIISAAKDAATGSFPIKLMASATINGRLVTHSAEPVIAGEAPRKQKRGKRTPAEDRVVNDAFLTVLDTAPFVLDLISLTADTDQGQGTTIDVRSQRADGFTNDIQLTVEGYSLGREPISQHVDVPAVTLKHDQSRAQVKLNAKVSAETGTRTIVVKGTTTLKGQTSAQYTQTIPLTIHPIPFTLANSLPRLSVAALPPESKSAAGEAVFSVKADRRAGFNGEIALTLEGLPEGIVATFDKISPDQSEATVKLTATGKAPVGKEISFNFLGVGMFNDRNYKQRTPAIKLTVTAPEESVASAKK